MRREGAGRDERDERGRDGTGLGWAKRDGTIRDGAIVQDGTMWGGTGRDDMGRDGPGRYGTGRDMPQGRN